MLLCCSQVVYDSAEEESQADRQAVLPDKGQVANTRGVCAMASVSAPPCSSC